MMCLRSSFHRSSCPSPATVESDNELSTGLEIGTRVRDRPPQRSQSSPPWLVRQPHSGRAELQRLLRSH